MTGLMKRLRNALRWQRQRPALRQIELLVLECTQSIGVSRRTARPLTACIFLSGLVDAQVFNTAIGAVALN